MGILTSPLSCPPNKDIHPLYACRAFKWLLLPEGGDHSSRLVEKLGTVTIEEPLLPQTSFGQQLPPLKMEQMKPLEELYRNMRSMFRPDRFQGRPFVVRKLET